MRDLLIEIPAHLLAPGMLVDTEGWWDDAGDDATWAIVAENELFEVFEVEEEAVGYLRIDFTDGPSYGIAPEELVPVRWGS